MMYYAKSLTEELVWQDEEGDKTPEGCIQKAEWDGRTPYVTLTIGKAPVVIPFSGWPQETA